MTAATLPPSIPPARHPAHPPFLAAGETGTSTSTLPCSTLLQFHTHTHTPHRLFNCGAPRSRMAHTNSANAPLFLRSTLQLARLHRPLGSESASPPGLGCPPAHPTHTVHHPRAQAFARHTLHATTDTSFPGSFIHLLPPNQPNVLHSCCPVMVAALPGCYLPLIRQRLPGAHCGACFTIQKGRPKASKLHPPQEEAASTLPANGSMLSQVWTSWFQHTSPRSLHVDLFIPEQQCTSLQQQCPLSFSFLFLRKPRRNLSLRRPCDQVHLLPASSGTRVLKLSLSLPHPGGPLLEKWYVCVTLPPEPTRKTRYKSEPHHLPTARQERGPSARVRVYLSQ